MSTSKLQRIVGNMLFLCFGQYAILENTRPSWLTTDVGDRLELDFFIEELQVAIEVQGEQHYRFSAHFHRDGNGYISQLKRDQVKKRKCRERGICLLEVYNESDVDSAINTISAIAKEAKRKTKQPLAVQPKYRKRIEKLQGYLVQLGKSKRRTKKQIRVELAGSKSVDLSRVARLRGKLQRIDCDIDRCQDILAAHILHKERKGKLKRGSSAFSECNS